MRPEPIERRLARIESRIVQIMNHLGIDPYERMYAELDTNPKHRQNTDADTQRRSALESGAVTGFKKSG
jgi:hypothetical protein